MVEAFGELEDPGGDFKVLRARYRDLCVGKGLGVNEIAMAKAVWKCHIYELVTLVVPQNRRVFDIIFLKAG